ncbi:MAG: hypothetical protein WDN31_16475 [Hyphomicrobium sp.]
MASAPFRPEWLIVPIAVLTVANVYAERALYADFSYVLVRLLDLRQFFWFDLIQRSGNALLTQIPIVVALKLGVTSLPLLKLLFNVSIYGAYLCLMLLIFAVAQRREDFYFPALSYFTASAFFQSFLSEAHTTVLLAWLLAVLIIPRRPLSAPLKALALAAAAVMMLTYETSVVFALFFAAISARRVRVARDEAWFWGVADGGACSRGRHAGVVHRAPPIPRQYLDVRNGNRKGAVEHLSRRRSRVLRARAATGVAECFGEHGGWPPLLSRSAAQLASRSGCSTSKPSARCPRTSIR